MSGLNDEITGLIGIDLNKSIHHLRKWTHEAYVLKAACEYMERERERVLAKEMMRLREKNPKLSVAAAKVEALVSGRYGDFLIQMRDAREKWAEAEAERVSREKALETGRSFLAYERQQIVVAGQT